MGKFPKNTRSDGAIRCLYELAYYGVDDEVVERQGEDAKLNMEIVRGLEDVDVKKDADELVLTRGGESLNHIAEWDKAQVQPVQQEETQPSPVPFPTTDGAALKNVPPSETAEEVTIVDGEEMICGRYHKRWIDSYYQVGKPCMEEGLAVQAPMSRQEAEKRKLQEEEAEKRRLAALEKKQQPKQTTAGGKSNFNATEFPNTEKDFGTGDTRPGIDTELPESEVEGVKLLQTPVSKGHVPLNKRVADDPLEYICACCGCGERANLDKPIQVCTRTVRLISNAMMMLGKHHKAAFAERRP